MQSDYYYLKDNIKIEPLVWKWYLWPHLIPPTTAALNLVGRYFKIMESYLNDPELHKKSAHDPKLLGYPFMNIDPTYVDEVRQLFATTKSECQSLISLNEDIKKFDKLLQNIEHGMSLEPFYKNIPDSLRGCVELVYDLNNHPMIRFIEPFLYRKYYNTKFQSLNLSIIEKDYRPYAFSTPRLSNGSDLELNVAFSDPLVDDLLLMRKIPRKKEDIINSLKLDTPQINKFNLYFTGAISKVFHDNNYRGDKIRVRYFGHAGVLLEIKDFSILIDPVLSYHYPSPLKRFSFNDLPDTIDYIICTHGHDDHVMLETLIQLRHKIKHIIVPENNNGFLADPSLKLIFKHIGFKSILTLRELETILFANGEIVALPFLGEHTDLNIQSKLSYLVRLRNKKFLFLADSNNLDQKLYEHIADLFGQVDVIFVGMECVGASMAWLYGPLLTNPLKKEMNQSRRFKASDSEKATQIVKQMKCKEAYIYAMGQEPWLSYFMAIDYHENSHQIVESHMFIKNCRYLNVKSELLYAQREWFY